MCRVDHLTGIQVWILRRIREHLATHGETAAQGEPPTITQIGTVVGLRSRALVHYQLGELETRHAIVREPGQCGGNRLA
ncbi:MULTISPECIES: LexA family protein [unclassified Streptomyces]|uniref:LexA family protein n=1 Tax=unclassified Streptomyces TaxID=2593676 RepID=UPI00369BE59E